MCRFMNSSWLCPISLAEPIPSLFERSKTIKNPIIIKMDANGKPDIPSVTMVDGYHTKTIQAALRHYCMAHIRECAVIHPIIMYPCISLRVHIWEEEHNHLLVQAF